MNNTLEIPGKQKKAPLLILAPMAGITDLPFRLICRESGADMVYSEMISATGLFYNSEKTKGLLQTIPEEQPIVFQLFGSNPEHFAKAAYFITKLIKKTVTQKSGLDINFGCPTKKVLKQGAGCALMKNLKLSRRIVESVLENSSLPVSLKIRTGIEKTNAIDFLENIKDLPWKTVIIHGRTFKQGFSGPIDLELIKKIKLLFPDKTIIANGGIKTPENVKSVFEKTGSDGVAIATGALGKPWIFKQVKDYLESGSYEVSNLEIIKQTAFRHAEYYKKFKGNNFTKFRKHLNWYFKDLPSAKKIRKRLFEIEKYEDVAEIIDKVK